MYHLLHQDTNTPMRVFGCRFKENPWDDDWKQNLDKPIPLNGDERFSPVEFLVWGHGWKWISGSEFVPIVSNRTKA